MPITASDLAAISGIQGVSSSLWLPISQSDSGYTAASIDATNADTCSYTTQRTITMFHQSSSSYILLTNGWPVQFLATWAWNLNEFTWNFPQLQPKECQFRSQKPNFIKHSLLGTGSEQANCFIVENTFKNMQIFMRKKVP